MIIEKPGVFAIGNGGRAHVLVRHRNEWFGYSPRGAEAWHLTGRAIPDNEASYPFRLTHRIGNLPGEAGSVPADDPFALAKALRNLGYIVPTITLPDGTVEPDARPTDDDIAWGEAEAAKVLAGEYDEHQPAPLKIEPGKSYRTRTMGRAEVQYVTGKWAVGSVNDGFAIWRLADGITLSVPAGSKIAEWEYDIIAEWWEEPETHTVWIYHDADGRIHYFDSERFPEEDLVWVAGPVEIPEGFKGKAG